MILKPTKTLNNPRPAWTPMSLDSIRPQQTGYSRLNYTPTTDLDYGTISCWGRNAIGEQQAPCIFQVVAAGMYVAGCASRVCVCVMCGSVLDIPRRVCRVLSGMLLNRRSINTGMRRSITTYSPQWCTSAYAYLLSSLRSVRVHSGKPRAPVPSTSTWTEHKYPLNARARCA